MKKILITGGAGFIGSHLGQSLAASGDCQIDLIDNFSRTGNNPEIISRDLRQPNVLDDLGRDYNLIYHFAALLGVANVLEKPFEVLCDNTLMVTRVLEFAQLQKKLQRFIFASTSEVYAGTLRYFQMQIPTPETTPLTVTDLSSPRSSYMLSKIYGEALCHYAGVPFTILRPHNIYGPRMGSSHVIPQLLEKAHYAEKGGELEVYSPTHRRTFCYIDDALRWIRFASEKSSTLGQTLNVGNNSPEISMRDLAKLVAEVVGKDLKIVERSDTEGSPTRRAPDNSRIISSTGSKSAVDLRSGVERTYDWYRKNIFNFHRVSSK